MMNLSQIFRKPLQEVPISTIVFVLIVALIGFADATYLTIEHFRGVIPPCSATGGCETVLTGPYAAPLGIPVALVGAVFYLAVVVSSFMYIESKHAGALRPYHRSFLKWVLIFTVLAMLASLWFIFVQAFILHAYCIYCLGSATTSIILFVTAMHIFSKYHETF